MINVSKNLLAFLGCFLFVCLGFFGAYYICVCEDHFQKLVSGESMIDLTAIDIQIGAL